MRSQIRGVPVMLTEHEMLVTLATMALRMNDLTGHDVIEALKVHGFGGVVTEARERKARATRSLLCKQPDRDEPRIECGYSLPCPHHTAVIDLGKHTTTIPHSVTPVGKARIRDIARALKK